MFFAGFCTKFDLWASLMFLDSLVVQISHTGNASTGFVLIFSFKALKALCYLPPHWKTYFTLVKAYKGEEMNDKLAIKFLQYWDTPKKLPNSITLFFLGQFWMNSTLEGSIFSSPLGKILRTPPKFIYIINGWIPTIHEKLWKLFYQYYNMYI